MGTPFEKSLRTNGTSTPRNKINNRYGPVGSGSRGPIDADELDGSPVQQAEPSPAVGRNTTPRSAGRYGSPFGQMHGFGGPNGSTPRGRSGLAPPRPPVPRQNRALDVDADAASVAESDDVSVMTEDDYGPQEGDSVQVFVRVRPTNEAESAEADGYNCTRLYGERSVSVELRHRPEPYHFKFDCVLPESTTQEEVFERAGKPIVDNCMGGYNSSIFAYGQTGAGKTYTMQGPLDAALQYENPQRGLAPRVFQYLFSEIDKAQDEKCHENLTFSCKCSMLEIYNEVITDLLNPDATNLQIREDIKRGCYVEDLSSHSVQNVSDAMALMRKGADNRHVGETRLNRESSRSHSVFTCVLERQSKNQATGITNVLFSRLNLIDLAGSERVHGGEHGGSQVAGKHFKEACHINKSLTTLGRVITELVEAQRTAHTRGNSSVGKGVPANRSRHVPYRDSRLTFLLQDSLGGNAKTLMIANISPCSVSGVETLSTLQFMSRAKCIRNRAKINLDSQGDVAELQREILRLNNELDNLRKGYTEPAIQEAKQLREELKVLRDSRGETEIRLVNLEKENHNLKSERRRLDNKLAQVQKGSNQLTATMVALAVRITCFEDQRTRSEQISAQVAEMEKQVLQAELEAALQESQGASELQQVVEQLQQQLQEVHAAAASSSAAAEAAAAELAEVRAQLAAEQQQSASLSEEAAAAQAQSAELSQQLQETQLGLARLTEQLQGTQQESAAMTEQLHSAQQERADIQQQLSTAQQETATVTNQLEAANEQAAQLQEQLNTSSQRTTELEAQLSSTQEELSGLSAQLAAAQQDKTGLQDELAAVQQESLGLAEQLAASQQSVADLQEQLESSQQGSSSLSEQLEATKQELAGVVQQLETAQQDAAAVARQMQEERQATQLQLSELAASLEASTADAQSLKQQLQQSREEAQGLQTDSDAVRQQLAQEQQEHLQVKQTLADAQEQLAATLKELEQAQEMATCSEAEASKRLADALAAAEASQQALQEERNTTANLQQQLTALQEQLTQTQQDLQHEAEARKQDSDAAAASQAASEAIEQQLREQLEATQAQLTAKQETLDTLSTEQQELASKLGLKQQAYSELQQQLTTEQDRSAEARSQVAALEEAMAELNSLVKEKSTALESAQEQIRQLQQAMQHKEDALAAAATKHEQLSGDLASLREGSKGKQDELMKQVTEVHMQLSAAQQEQERLQEELDALRNDNSALQAQLTDAQAETDNLRGQASNKGLEIDLLQKRLSAAESNVGTLRTDLAEAQQQAAALRAQMQEAEIEAGESQAAAEEQLSDLNRKLLDKEQVLQEYEYERSQMQRRMEELSQRLMDKSTSLDGSRSEIQALKATIRDQSNAARRQEAALADQTAYARQLQAENASLSSRLQDVSEQLADREAELRNKLTCNELQLKEQIVYNARNRQAMNEIRKVINWAQQMPTTVTTPPHPSRPGSSASRRAHPQLQPYSHLETSSIPGSPSGSHYGELLPVEQQYVVPEQQLDEHGRGVPPALLPPPNSSHLTHQGSGGSNSSSSRHHGGHSHSRHHHQHHTHSEHRYGEAVGSNAGSRAPSEAGSAAGYAGSSSGRHAGKARTGGSSPSKLAARAGEMLPMMLQVSEDLAVETAAEEPAASTYSERDTAGGAPPLSPALSEAASSSFGALGGRSRGHRMDPGSPARSSASKQQMAAAMAAAAQHKLPPDQQQHHAHVHGHARAQERYATDVEDDTLGAPVAEDSFEEAQEGHAYGSASRGSAAGDDRHLMAPQQASSPVPPSPSKELPHGSISRSRAGRDTSSRRGLRAGSDSHNFSSISGKRHKMVPGEAQAHPVVLSVSGDWSAGGHDSIPDMRLPAAIVGDDSGEA